ncbi:SPL family radical SAM protein [Legionella sp. D16C41]|uniref:SPL family radical SAM protein n=1 Tax=Legionella sp. D16C41 TaxID=3402688 RepID=UPI003AF89304
MPQLITQKTKTLKIRPNGRSADFITPNFIYGCAGGCRNSYCYVMRHNFNNIYINENVDEILGIINNHLINLPTKIPNQTDDKYWTYDIGCSTDVSLHWKHTDWLKIFAFFKQHPKGKATFATKYVNSKLLEFNPQKKVRIRFSIMPQQISSTLEPKTTPITERINAVNVFIEAGYDVHLNFSPIIVYEGWLDEYRDLFILINETIENKYKPQVKAECIFLTHNAKQHERNIELKRFDSESLIWRPDFQESKVSQYGGEAVRYKLGLKKNLIQQWLALHNQYLAWNTIRYIF